MMLIGKQVSFGDQQSRDEWRIDANNLLRLIQFNTDTPVECMPSLIMNNVSLL